MIDDGNILIPYHIQAKRQQEALQKEALRRQFITQQKKKGFEMGDSAKDLKSDFFKTIRAVAKRCFGMERTAQQIEQPPERIIQKLYKYFFSFL